MLCFQRISFQIIQRKIAVLGLFLIFESCAFVAKSVCVSIDLCGNTQADLHVFCSQKALTGFPMRWLIYHP